MHPLFAAAFTEKTKLRALLLFVAVLMLAFLYFTSRLFLYTLAPDIAKCKTVSHSLSIHRHAHDRLVVDPTERSSITLNSEKMSISAFFYVISLTAPPRNMFIISSEKSMGFSSHSDTRFSQDAPLFSRSRPCLALFMCIKPYQKKKKNGFGTFVFCLNLV